MNWTDKKKAIPEKDCLLLLASNIDQKNPSLINFFLNNGPPPP